MMAAEPEVKVTVRVTLRTPDGQEWVTETGGYWSEASAESHWTEGNYSCDCNRALFVRQAQGLPWDTTAGDDDDDPCGHAITLVSLVNAETGKILVGAEREQEGPVALP